MYLTFVGQQQLNEVAKESQVSPETGYTRNQNMPNMKNLGEQTLPISYDRNYKCLQYLEQL